jgi:hypothetical protein
MRHYVDLETALGGARPRVRDYAEAARRVNSGRLSSTRLGSAPPTSKVPGAGRRG